jgi:putative endonuclease
MPRERRIFGIWAERLAARRLEEKGYLILESNFRCREGEIDLVALDGDVLAFVEVKARRGTGFGTPSSAVGAEKRRRIILAARRYLADRRPRAEAIRFDVVTVLVRGGGIEPEVGLIRGAFDVG